MPIFACCMWLQVPRVHAILITKRSVFPALLVGDAAAAAPQLRQQALDWLAQAVGGDRLVAEYLLLQLVSRSGRGPS